MYDRTREPNEFVGESVEDATEEAARFYGVEGDALTVVVPPMGDVAGAGARAVIVAFPTDMQRRPSRPSGDGDERGRGRDRERGRRDRKGDGDRDRDRGRGRGRRGRDSEEAAPDAPVESKGTAVGEVGPMGDFLLGVVERMAVGSFEISESAEDDFLVYQIRGDAAGVLRSGDGRGVDALQLLVNQAAKQALDEAPRVVVDVEGGAEDREESLSRLADRAAGRASDTGRAIALDPMNPRDRRIVHVALRDREGIATMSIGEGRYRQVVVVPEGAPEYEEARGASGGSDS